MGDMWVGGDITLIGSGVIRTAASGKRIQIPASTGDQVLFYSGSASETAPGKLEVDTLQVLLEGVTTATYTTPPRLWMLTDSGRTELSSPLAAATGNFTQLTLNTATVV